MYKEDSALDNLQWLICHKTKRNSRGESKSHWKMLILTSSSTTGINSTFRFSMALVVTFSWIFVNHYYHITPLRVFLISVSWWSLTGVWVLAILLESPGLFSVFCPILSVLSIGWSPLVILFPSPPVPVPILWWLYQEHQLQLVSQSLWCSIFFSVPWQDPGTHLSFRFFSVLPCSQPGRQSPQFDKFSIFCWLSLCLVVWPGLNDPFIFQNPRELLLLLLSLL